MIDDGKRGRAVRTLLYNISWRVATHVPLPLFDATRRGTNATTPTALCTALPSSGLHIPHLHPLPVLMLPLSTRTWTAPSDSLETELF